MPTLEVEALHKTYPGGIEAVRGLSFSVAAGEVFALLGPNGAGKSTTQRILTTLTRPTSGRARVAGFDVLTQGLEVRRRIGAIAQASGVDPLETGRANLHLQGHLHHLPGAELRTRASELLALFGLSGAADRPVAGYSGGMKRRLDVALGLIHRPQILFLDEPTTGLDPESRAVMWSEIGRLADSGLTVLLTTHYLEEADRLAQRLAIVDAGRIVAEGTPSELKRRLGRDRIVFELARAEQLPAALALLRAQPGLEGHEGRGRSLSVQVESGPRAIPALVAALEAAGCEVSEVATRRPSLDDVYLQATGLRFDERDAPAAARGPA